MRLAVFFDRDDTLLRTNLDCLMYITQPEQINPVQGVSHALSKLSEVGAKLFVATNQNCISEGIITSTGVSNLNDAMVAAFAEDGIFITSVAVAHGNRTDYEKAQSKGALIRGLRSIHAPDVPVENCWMVGDKWSDMKAGKIAGYRTIHLWYPDSYIVDYLEDEEIHEAAKVMRGPMPVIDVPHFCASNMEEVVKIILSSGP